MSKCISLAVLSLASLNSQESTALELPLAQTRRGDPSSLGCGDRPFLRLVRTDLCPQSFGLLGSFQAQLKFLALVCTGPVTSGPCLL